MHLQELSEDTTPPPPPRAVGDTGYRRMSCREQVRHDQRLQVTYWNCVRCATSPVSMPSACEATV